MPIPRLSIAAAIALSISLTGCGDAATNEVASRDDAPATLEQPVMGPERSILAFGDSLFAGYNVAKEDSYPAKLEVALRARGINARVTNAGVSGDTSAAGLQRLEFTLNSLAEKPDLAIVELGGNDLLRGLPVGQTRANLSAILEELGEREIPVLLMGMRAPPNLGNSYVSSFDGLYPELAEQYDVDLHPFFMEPLVGRPALIQPDRIHPTEQGIEELVAATSGAVVDALPPAD